MLNEPTIVDFMDHMHIQEALKNLQTQPIIPEIHETYPELYHYTKQAGISGILEKQYLRATHALAPSLPDEMVSLTQNVVSALIKNPLSRKIVTRHIPGKEAENQINFYKLQQFFPRMEQYFGTAYGDSQALWDAFITSFIGFNPSVEPDSKFIEKNGHQYHWKTYGGGIDNSYAIVLDTKALNNAFFASSVERQYSCIDAFLTKIVYPHLAMEGTRDGWEKNVQDNFKKLIDTVILRFRNILPEEQAVKLFMKYYLRTALALKKPSYLKDDEVRFVYFQNAKNKHQNMNIAQFNALSRKEIFKIDPNKYYINIFEGVEKLPINRIIIGPGMHQQARADKINDMLYNKHIDADVYLCEYDVS